MIAFVKNAFAIVGLVWMLFAFTMLTIVLPIQIFLNMF